jgi:hypothetical protein
MPYGQCENCFHEEVCSPTMEKEMAAAPWFFYCRRVRGAHSLDIHDGKAKSIVIWFVCFAIAGILFPFRMGGEDWNE